MSCTCRGRSPQASTSRASLLVGSTRCAFRLPHASCAPLTVARHKGTAAAALTYTWYITPCLAQPATLLLLLPWPADALCQPRATSHEQWLCATTPSPPASQPAQPPAISPRRRQNRFTARQPGRLPGGQLSTALRAGTQCPTASARPANSQLEQCRSSGQLLAGLVAAPSARLSAAGS